MDFNFTIHLRDKYILYKIKFYFCAGVISKHVETLTNYSIRSIKDIPSVVNHFDKFPLKTTKINDYKLFKLAFNILKTKSI